MDPHVTPRPWVFRPSSSFVAFKKYSQYTFCNHHVQNINIQMWPTMDLDMDVDMQGREIQYANYLPDELLLQVLDCLPRNEESQKVLANFVLVSRYVDGKKDVFKTN